jgi:hemerythrin-like domain-containing protein
MAQMSMNRVIHSALRRDLARFDTALGAFVEGDSRRAEQLWTAWVNFDDQLTTHHLGEHDIVWPTLRQLGMREDLITQWDHEHEQLAEGLRTTGDAMRELRRSPSAANAKSASDAMAKLSEVASTHLDHEEADLEPFYLARKDTPEIKAMNRKFARVKPPVAGTFFAWLQDGATADAVAGLKQNVPPPVVAVLTTLFGRSYRRTIAPVWAAYE